MTPNSKLYKVLLARAAIAADAAPTPGALLVIKGTEIYFVPYGGVDGDALLVDSVAPSGWSIGPAGGGGGGAPTNAEYLVLTVNAGLSNERAIALGAGLAAVDGGAGGAWTLSPSLDLAAVEGLATTGYAARIGTSSWVTRSFISTDGSITITNPDGVSGPSDFEVNAALIAPGVLDQQVDDRFGDGSDGNLTLTGNISLSRDMQYDTLDLAGFTIDASGYRVRCLALRDTAGGGVIHNNGGNGSGPSQGTAAPAGSIGGGAAGGGGGTAGGNGSAGTNRATSWPSKDGTSGVSGRGGAGGASGQGQTGGASGTVADPNANSGYGGLYMWDTGRAPSDAAALSGGSGGGGGGCGAGAGARGGGGGGSAGVCMVFARDVDVPGTTEIRANGGVGGNATAGVSLGAAGGGGGGGGMAVFTYETASGGLPNVVAAGGTGGTATGTGAAGTNGAAGRTRTRHTRV